MNKKDITELFRNISTLSLELEEEQLSGLFLLLQNGFFVEASVGCTIEDKVFIATGAAVFHSAFLGTGSEVRVNGVVHIKTHLAAGETVPIGWVAVGNPAQVLPSSEHERIWEIQRPLDFPRTVYGFERSGATMEKITRRLSETLGSHLSDDTST